MPSATATVLADALLRVEQVLADFGKLNDPALEAFNAGAAALVADGREPNDNQLLALHNLIDMFDLGLDAPATTPLVEAPAPVPDLGLDAPTAGTGAAAVPLPAEAAPTPLDLTAEVTAAGEAAPAPEPLAGAGPVDAGADTAVAPGADTPTDTKA